MPSNKSTKSTSITLNSQVISEKPYSQSQIKLAKFTLIFSISFILIGYFIFSYVLLNFAFATLLMSLAGYSVGILISQKIFEKAKISKDLFINNGNSALINQTQASRMQIYEEIKRKTKFLSRYNGLKFKIWNFFLSFVLAEIIFICVSLNLKVAFYNLSEFFPNNSFLEKISRVFKLLFEKVDEFFLKIFNFFGVDLKEKEIVIVFAPIIMIFFISLNSIWSLGSNFLKSEKDMHNLLELYKETNEAQKKDLLKKIDSNSEKNNSFEILVLNDLFENSKQC